MYESLNISKLCIYRFSGRQLYAVLPLCSVSAG